jgi:hypothetical protein
MCNRFRVTVKQLELAERYGVDPANPLPPVGCRASPSDLGTARLQEHDLEYYIWRMARSRNIVRAVEDGDSGRFLELLDRGFRSAARKGSEESHALSLTVMDGRSCEVRAPKGD